MTNQELRDEINTFVKKWVKGQSGSCMCLGDCDVCGFHKCHGCICIINNFIISKFDAHKKTVRDTGLKQKKVITTYKQDSTDNMSLKELELSVAFNAGIDSVLSLEELQ